MPDFKQMGEFIEMLILEGLVIGRLGTPVDLPLAMGSGAPPVWIKRSEIVDGKSVSRWHRTDTSVAVLGVDAPTLCGQLEGARVFGFHQSLSALSEEQLKDACPSCLQHDKEGTSKHEPTPERHMLLCCLFPSIELMIQLKDGDQSPHAYFNERFGFGYFVEEGSLPSEWPEIQS